MYIGLFRKYTALVNTPTCAHPLIRARDATAFRLRYDKRSFASVCPLALALPSRFEKKISDPPMEVSHWQAGWTALDDVLRRPQRDTLVFMEWPEVGHLLTPLWSRRRRWRVEIIGVLALQFDAMLRIYRVAQKLRTRLWWST